MTRFFRAVCMCAAGLALCAVPCATLANARHSTLLILSTGGETNLELLDARLDDAAVTAALILSLEANRKTAMEVWKIAVSRKWGSAEEQAALLRASEIESAIEAAMESYEVVIDRVARQASSAEIAGRMQTLERNMTYRGQTPIKAGFQVILAHIKAIVERSALSRDRMKEDLLNR